MDSGGGASQDPFPSQFYEKLGFQRIGPVAWRLAPVGSALAAVRSSRPASAAARTDRQYMCDALRAIGYDVEVDASGTLKATRRTSDRQYMVDALKGLGYMVDVDQSGVIKASRRG